MPRTPEEKTKMIAQLKNLQSQGQSRDLQIEAIEKGHLPDIYDPEYKGPIPDMTDEEKQAVSWLYGRSTDEQLIGAHSSGS